MSKLTQRYLKEILSYDPETGHFYWLKPWGRRRMDVPAGHTEKDALRGYIIIGIDRVNYQAHRLAWLYVHGAFPRDCLDHINGIRTDNKIANLRECSHSENQKNMKRPSHNTSGFKGVHFYPQNGKWRARIRSNGRHYSLGFYDSKETAHAAYCAAAEKLNGAFARFQ